MTTEHRMRFRSAGGAVLGILVAACGGTSAPEVVPVAVAARPGLEVILGDSAALIAGKRVGLVTNQSGVDATGVSGVDRLRAAGVRLVALFSPEHGFRGTADPGEAVASTVDPATGLPIYSLYGRNRVPSDSVMRSLDVMLVDLQDAGARY
ncbi:MAG TPA: exo-beta-N-acetylmuramidase NamZ domain-containing protein, partial [Gemmatimonadales bacterium]|nr:exo-beta-N-acetylmuramidase NamZ domain-containing protein [Gemmatimonadales bacterium]